MTWLAELAALRPGGGESYSGGGGFGQSSSDSDGGGALVFELVFHLLRLCFYYPSIGLPIVAFVVGWFLWQSYKARRDRDWNSGPPVELARSSEPTDVVRVDPDFSVIVFQDFVFRLHAAAHRARGDRAALEGLAPYVGPAARAALLAMPPGEGIPVAAVVVGALRVTGAEVPAQPVDASGQPTRIALTVEIEGNVTAGAQTFYTVERWQLTRAATAHTRPPSVRTFPCPSCGAPWQAVDSPGGQRCSYCGEVVDNGRFDWQVTRVELLHADPRPPTLTTDVPERGTDLPTRHQPGVTARWSALLAADPALDAAAFHARVELTHRELNAAWTRGDLTAARPFVSDSLHDYLSYWVDAYRAQGLRNVLEDTRLRHQDIAKVASDRWYDAVTVRIWADGLDYVVDSGGDVVRGSRQRRRAYSEYWTFIRARARRGAARVDLACPNCGAPLVITMAGACQHCGAHVTAGEFDWVLSRIEQDDSYRG
jgi:hypothetical protein